MADGASITGVGSLSRHLLSALVVVPLLGYAGFDRLSERHDQAEQDRLYRALTTKQVQQCLSNANEAGVQMTRNACEDLIRRWYDGEPLSGRQHSLMSGWAFGDFEPSQGAPGSRPLIEVKEVGRVHVAETDGVVLLFAKKADGKSIAELRLSVGADETSLADTKCPGIGHGGICAVARGQSWMFPASDGTALSSLNWLAMPSREDGCCPEAAADRDGDEV